MNPSNLRARSSGCAALLCLALALFTVSPDAHASDLAEEAELHFQIGAEKYQAGDFRTALEHFLASNRLVPNRNVQFNIARCYEQLGQFPSAWKSYKAVAAAEKDPAAKQRIQEALERIGAKVAILDIETDPPGADVFIDRVDLGSRGVGPLSLGVAGGKVRIIARREGFVEATSAEIDATVGQISKVKLTLKPILGRLIVRGPEGAVVRLDKADAPPIGTAPFEKDIPQGSHILFVEKPGFRKSETPISVPANGKLEVDPALERRSGSVVVSSDLPGGLVEVDGQASGFTPIVLNLPIGAHKVRFSLEGFSSLTRTIDVKEGTRQTLDFELGGKEEVRAVSRTAESLEFSPASVTVIPTEELRAFAYPTIVEAVRGTRGIFITDDRTYTVIGVRGLSRPGEYGNKTLLLMDGHTQNENILFQSFTSFDGLIDLDNVQRVEIVRGPVSALYGTGAFSGVINLVTHEPDGPSRLEAGVSATVDNTGRGRALGFWHFGDPGEDRSLWASVSYAKSLGRDFFFQDYVLDDEGRNSSTGGNARGLDGFVGWNTQGRFTLDSLTVQWFWNSREKRFPTGIFDTTFGDPDNFILDRRGFVEARFEPKLTDWLQSLSRVYMNLYFFDAGYPYAEEVGGRSVEHYDGIWGGVEQRFVLKPVDELKITVGGEVQRSFKASMFGEDSTGAYVDESPNAYTVAGGFGNVDIDLSTWGRISGGARVDAFLYEKNDAGPDAPETVVAVSPHAAFIAKPYEGGVLKVMGGRAFRAPSAYQLFYRSTVQERPTSLEPEEIYSGEIEYSHRFTSNLVGTLAGFTNYARNFIVDRGGGTEDDPLVYANSDAPIVTGGAEVELKREFRGGWSLGGNYSFQHSTYLGDEAETLRQVPNSPNHSVGVKGIAPIVSKLVRLASRISFEGVRYDRNEEDIEGLPIQGKTDVSFLWDIVLTGEAFEDTLSYALGVYNVIGDPHETPVSAETRMTTVSESGRSFIGSLKIKLE